MAREIMVTIMEIMEITKIKNKLVSCKMNAKGKNPDAFS